MKKKLSSADDHEANMLFWFKMQATVNYKSYLDTKNAFKIIAKVHCYLFTSGVLHNEFLSAYTSTAVKLF